MALKITLGEPRMISDQYGNFPGVSSLRDGTLFLNLCTGADVVPDPDGFRKKVEEARTVRSCKDYIEQLSATDAIAQSNDFAYWTLRSTDGGKSFHDWGKPPIGIHEDADGKLWGLDRFPYRKDGQWVFKLWTSEDSGGTWDGPQYIPAALPPLMDGDSSISLHRSYLATADGSVLILAYGQFRGDKKSRMILLRTNDRFQSVHYYATVACAEENPGITELTEGVLARLPSGRIVCMMRQDSYLPMYQTWSDNDGATWAPIVPCGSDGVDPDLCVMKNGLVVCSYGRPYVNIMVSRDGVTWSNRTCIRNTPIHYRGLTVRERSYHERSDCYTSVRTIADDKVLLFYSAPVDESDMSICNPWDKTHLPYFRIWALEITITEA